MLLINTRNNNIKRNNYLNYITNILNTNLEILSNGITKEERLGILLKLLKSKNENIYDNPFNELFKNLARINLKDDVNLEKLKEYINLVLENTKIMQMSLEELVVFKESPTNIFERSIYASNRIMP